MTDWGRRAAKRIDDAARASVAGPGVTRLPFTHEHRAMLGIVTGWMQSAGMKVSLDAAGTLIGRLEGPRGSGTLFMGSHQDSVREGGAFDGVAGIVLPCLALEKLARDGKTLPFSVEVLAFPDEEGIRFPTALVGPRALAGTFDPGVLDLPDRSGTSLRDAMNAFGLEPDKIVGLKRKRKSAIGFLETHIEQGPVLEEAGEPLGIVTAICGIERHSVTLTGSTGHAGTIPMASRRDALVGAASLVLEVNRMGRETPGVRATIGALDVRPNAANAVPGEVNLTIEIRSADDTAREVAGKQITAFAHDLAAREGLSIDMDRSYSQPAEPCDPALSALLTKSVEATGNTPVRLPSGATHDASAMADLCPMAMLFIRCRDGVSHVPEEYASPEDLGAAVTVIAETLLRLKP